MKMTLNEQQMEQVTVTTLDQLHRDLKEELKAHGFDPYLAAMDYAEVCQSLIAIEIVMRDLMFKDAYLNWKAESGVDL